MHRFYLASGTFAEKLVIFPETLVHQIRNVLRMRPGEEVIVFDGTGREYLITLQEVSRQVVEGEITKVSQGRGEPPLGINLFQALLKRDNFEWALQKGTEVGISSFTPILTTRVVAESRGESKRERWQRTIIEAAEQSGRCLIPRLNPVKALEAVTGDRGSFDLPLFLHTGSSSRPLRETLERWDADHPGVLPHVALIVGPEGGFTEEETHLAIAQGWIEVSVGHTILRAETAGVVAAANLIYHFGTH